MVLLDILFFLIASCCDCQRTALNLISCSQKVEDVTNDLPEVSEP